jgi:hypothetical protein
MKLVSSWTKLIWTPKTKLTWWTTRKHRESWTHHIMYRWLQIIQGLWSEKSHSCVRCGTKQGIFLTVPHSTLEHFWPASPQLWWYNCRCSANLFNDESFGALNSEKNLQQILSSPFSFDLHEMLCFKFSDICNKAGRRIDEKQPVKCSKFDFWFLKHWSTISQCSKG